MNRGARRAVEVYAEWLDHPASAAQWRCGSGYLLSARLILTAAHVVCPDGRPLSTVLVRMGAALRFVDVVWHGQAADLDAALLVVRVPPPLPPRWPHPVRFGKLVTSRSGQACEATGFPSVVAQPEQRDTHHAVGLLNPGSLTKAGRHAVEVTNPPAAPTADGSGWAGMSGAALLSEGLVIGVITTDPAGFGSRRLIAVPIEAITRDPGFRRSAEEHGLPVPLVEAVEFASLSERAPVPDAPAALLRADVAVAPFRPRPELERLLDWCRSPEWFSLRLLVGSGGQGKTRLARRLAEVLAAEGWACVLLADRATPAQVTVLRDTVVPTLVIIDYAESRGPQLGAVIEALTAADATTRLLLLARTAGSWRTDRVDPTPHLDVLADDRIVIELGSVEPTTRGRAEAWRQAADALVEPLAALSDYQDVDWAAVAHGLVTPALTGPRYQTILAVQMLALAMLLQAGDYLPDAGEQPEQVLLAHESRYWRRVADRFGVNLTGANRRYLVAVATLWGAADEAEARRTVAATGLLADPAATGNAAEWLAALYQDGHRYWSGMQPDVLADHLVAVVASRAELASTTVVAASPGQLEHGLTVLGRAHSDHPELSRVATDTVLAAGVAGSAAATAVAPRLERPAPLLDALEFVLPTADLATLEAVSGQWPKDSVVLLRLAAPFFVGLSPHLQGATAEETSRLFLMFLPRFLDWLTGLALSGDYAGAAELLPMMIDCLRLLAARDRSAHLADLASALVKSSAVHMAVQRLPEGLALAQEAVEVYRELARTGDHRRDLARAMRHLALVMAESGRPDEAVAVAEEAIAVNRELVAQDRVRQLPDLMETLLVGAEVLMLVGRADEARALSVEMVVLASESGVSLAESGVAEPALLHTVEEVGAAYRRDGPIGIARHAVERCRGAVRKYGDPARPELARELDQLADLYLRAERFDEAIDTAREAVENHLAATPDGDGHWAPLVQAQYRLVFLSHKLALVDDAFTAVQGMRAAVYRLPGPERIDHLNLLAETSNGAAADLLAAGRPEPALEARRTAVAGYQELVDAGRAHLPELAATTEHFVRQLVDAGHRAEGVIEQRKVVELYQRLLDSGERDHRRNLARSSTALATLLTMTSPTSAQGEALAPARQAVEIYRELAATDTTVSPELARATLQLAMVSASVGRQQDARRQARLAVEQLRELAAADPAHRQVLETAEGFLGLLHEGLVDGPGDVAVAPSSVPVRSSGPDVSPVLGVFADVLGRHVADELADRHARVVTSLSATADAHRDQHRRYQVLDWFLRSWLAGWLAVMPSAQVGSRSLRDLVPVIDASTAENAWEVVRTATWVPGLLISEYVAHTPYATLGAVVIEVKASVAEVAVRASGWDAAERVLPDFPRRDAVVHRAVETARQIAAQSVGPAVSLAVETAVLYVPDRRGGWALLRDTVRGYAQDDRAQDPSVLEAGRVAGQIALRPVVTVLQASALDLVHAMATDRPRP